ncbi:DUF5621 domain-containing protein [Legionella londiniensis]|uniref:DUF5621 domain-containing protein n=1 Tax=Legionella londiniensis TaxID=45068 RepID=A0A0W0VNV9_9GAMM|nr:DUF5621 domain-containing protein [Legionella londiniensis]KTD21783.1 hypothetical protein Llon_0948 [Legionella londiniensis]STX92159.1 Uncharacterised protein [Legionella londiniensis]
MAVLTVFVLGEADNSLITFDTLLLSALEDCAGEHILFEIQNKNERKTHAKTRAAAKEIIRWLSRQEGTENSINLATSNHAALTAIEIADRLHKIETYLARHRPLLSSEGISLLKKLNTLSINILAMTQAKVIDGKDSVVIPANVTRFTAILNMDSPESSIQPNQLTRLLAASIKTQPVLLPVYAPHIGRNDDGDQQSIRYFHYLLHQCLHKNGTALELYPLENIGSARQGSRKWLRICSEYHHEIERHFQGENFLENMIRFNHNLAFYVRHADFFINQLERELFKIAYPKVFNFLFEKNLFDRRFPDDSMSHPDAVVQELKQLKRNNPLLFKRLCRHELCRDKEGLIHGSPQGNHALEPCTTIMQILPFLLSKTFMANQEEFVKLASLEQEVYQLTFGYENKPSRLSIFSERRQAHKTKTIREEVQKIIHEPPATPAIKQQKILDSLENHYMHLLKANSNSELLSLLKRCLKRHGRRYQTRQTPLPKEILAGFVKGLFDLLKETISFIGHLGYVGGDILGAAGQALENFGKKTNAALGRLGYNPLKYLAAALAWLIQGIGFALKANLGLKPICNTVTSGIRTIRDAAVIAIRAPEIKHERNDDEDVAEHPCTV